MNNLKDIRWKQRFENFEKAFNQLTEAVEKIDELSVLEKEGLIQRYEYTFELSWKTLKDYIESKGLTEKFPRDVIKKSFQYDLIDDGEVWMDMLEKRNLMAHTYDEAIFAQTLDLVTSSYYQQIQITYKELKKHL